MLFYQKVAYFLTVSIVFSVDKQNFTAQQLKTTIAMNAKTSVFVICAEAIMYLLLYNLTDCTFKYDAISVHGASNYVSNETCSWKLTTKFQVKGTAVQVI